MNVEYVSGQVRKRAKQNVALDTSPEGLQLKVTLAQNECTAESDWKNRLLDLIEQGRK